MKKTIALAALAALAMTSAAAAMSPEEAKQAHYEHMKQVKAQQRAEREAKLKNPAAQSAQEKGFWSREAERAGFSGTGNRVGDFFKSLNPAPFLKRQEEAYNQRKSSGGAR